MSDFRQTKSGQTFIYIIKLCCRLNGDDVKNWRNRYISSTMKYFEVETEYEGPDYAIDKLLAENEEFSKLYYDPNYFVYEIEEIEGAVA